MACQFPLVKISLICCATITKYLLRLGNLGIIPSLIKSRGLPIQDQSADVWLLSASEVVSVLATFAQLLYISSLIQNESYSAHVHGWVTSGAGRGQIPSGRDPIVPKAVHNKLASLGLP